MTSDLDPNAPVFTPPPKNLSNLLKCVLSSPSSASSSSTPEPQCSRYSRKSARQQALNATSTPRPILGAKLPFPRPILGRKEDDTRDEAEEYIGKEFRNMNRRFRRVRLEDDEENKENRDNRDNRKTETFV
ncbi:uncharacterized protein LOC132701242 [Cylas formicarius]|uniref:uncharacterized protein LOC132701242 n=1 Tax=Cylas formicarius TaxID=197179 RepID=UPI00295844CE|nr:uncharacterized protein LOC132701242 [Cylas formicarius]